MIAWVSDSCLHLGEDLLPGLGGGGGGSLIWEEEVVVGWVVVVRMLSVFVECSPGCDLGLFVCSLLWVSPNTRGGYCVTFVASCTLSSAHSCKCAAL